MNEIWSIILNAFLSIVGVVISAILLPWLTGTVIPWLKEKRLYGIVKQFVQAAEKYATSHDINKKEWVIELLEAKGITVTGEVSALIESAVQELDIQVGKIAETIKNE